jgi:6-phosphogluconate dehydrogenase
MKIGFAGLGRMGLNMCRRALHGGHEVVAWNRSFDKTKTLADEAGAKPAQTLSEMVASLAAPRTVWVMLPAGQTTDAVITELSKLLDRGDLIIDGSNGYYKEDIRRFAELEKKGIAYMDAGVSGGIWGLERGYCIMTGGREDDFARVEPFIKTLCADKGYLHCGPHGSGHFVKMVHNGIEYAMMEAYGEGFEILKASQFGKELDMPAIAALWNQGSVVRSWLLELLESALKKDPGLKTVEGYVDDSGEGRWTVEQAVETGVPAHAITAALFKRFSSREHNAFSDRILAALRREFGGHAIKPGDGK